MKKRKKEVISKLRILKSGQKVATIPKMKETEDWKNEDLIRHEKVRTY